MSNQTKRDYSCAEKDLYSALKLGWSNFGNHVTEFRDFKLFYNEAYMATALTEIDAAMALPGNVARSGASEMLHMDVERKGKVCRTKFKSLKSYIDTAYPDVEEQKIQYGIAGQEYFRESGNKDWESLLLLNQSAVNYLNVVENYDKLVDGDNMPPAFKDALGIASVEFATLYEEFKLKEQTSEETASKIEANNACYKKGISMLKDGQVIFEDEPAVLSKFVFDSLLALINPPVAGVQGDVLDSELFTPIVGVSFIAQKDSIPARNVMVDLDGNFSEQLPEGEYVLTVSALGYVTQTINVSCKLTGLKKVNVRLVKEV